MFNRTVEFSTEPYRVMLAVGLSVVRLLGRSKTSRTSVKPYRYKAVWSAGQGADDSSRLETLTIIRPCRAFSFRPVRPAYDTLPVVSRYYNHAPTASLGIHYAPRMEVGAFSPSRFLSFIPVRSSFAWGDKKEESASNRNYADSSVSGEVSCRRYIISRIVPVIRQQR